jgi:hypothetical protein
MPPVMSLAPVKHEKRRCRPDIIDTDKAACRGFALRLI